MQTCIRSKRKANKPEKTGENKKAKQSANKPEKNRRKQESEAITTMSHNPRGQTWHRPCAAFFFLLEKSDRE